MGCDMRDNRFLFRAAIGLLSALVFWIILATFVVPAIIESAYRGESAPFLNDLISGQATHPVEHYLASWQEVSGNLLKMLVVVALFPVPLVINSRRGRSYLEAKLGRARVLKPVAMNTILALFGLALTSYLYFLDPVRYVYLVAEDYWAEYATFVIWGIAFCSMVWALLKHRELRRPGFFLLALGAFFVAMEEISWGQRVLGFQSSAFLVEHNRQGEVNLHNLLDFPRSTIIAIGVLLWSVGLPVLARSARWLHRWCDHLGIALVRIHLWPFFLLAIFLFLYHPTPMSGETAELFLGVAIAALSLDLIAERDRHPRTRDTTTAIVTTGMILHVFVLTASLVQLFPNQNSLRWALNRSATGMVRIGMYRQAGLLFDYMNEHPQFLRPETHMHEGVLLMKMERYADAERVLELALSEQERLREERPTDPAPSRRAAQVLEALMRHREAAPAFRAAIELDQRRLARATDPQAEGTARTSLGETFLAMGDCKRASEQLASARAISARAQDVKRLARLLQQEGCR